MAKVNNAPEGQLDSNSSNFYDNTDDTEIQNLSPHLKKLTERCRLISNEKIRIYEYKMSENYYSNYLRILTSGEIDPQKPTKRILIIGETGTGKTTLLNTMINNIYGVEYENSVRFKLILDKGEELAQSNQAKGQTSCVSVYKIGYQDGMKVDYNVILIDTPGFGDEGGIKKDREIAKQIEELFRDNNNDINTLNCVSFVVKSSSVRFTPSEQYVFDSILRLFGKDMESQITMMITFVDSVNKKPGVLSALKESGVNYNKCFKFNNGCLFAPIASETDSDESDELEKDLAKLQLYGVDHKFWQMNNINLMHFFRHVGNMDEKSLALSNEVIKIRNQLEIYVTKIQQDIDRGVMKLNELDDHNTNALKHQSDLESNREFEYTVREIVSVKVKLPDGQHMTNCNTCKKVCHDKCSYSCSKNTMFCLSMDNYFYPPKCRVCDYNCDYTHHSTDTFRYELQEKQVTKTSAELKARFDVAEGSLNQVSLLLYKLKEEFMNIQLDVMQKICDLKNAIDRLNEIALKPNPLSQIEYINRLIESEDENHKPGYQDRIIQLKDLKKNLQFLIDISNKGEDPFIPYLNNLESQIERKASRFQISEEFKTRLREICLELKNQSSRGLTSLSFMNFLSHVEIEKTSLKLPNKVLGLKYKAVLVDVTKIHYDIGRGVMNLNELGDHKTNALKHQRGLELNRDFEYTVREIVSVKVESPDGQHMTNCNTCKKVCHENCFDSLAQTMYCIAMDQSSSPPKCRVCDNHCDYTQHSNNTYRYELQEKQVTKTSADLKARFDVAEGSFYQVALLLNKLKEEFVNIQLDVLKKICDLKNAIDRLNEIAEQPNPLSQIDCIDKLIDSENENHKPGYQGRITQLKDLREKLQFLIDINDKGEDPFIQYLNNLETENRFQISEECKTRLREICLELKKQN